jgi:hypothetical protein
VRAHRRRRGRRYCRSARNQGRAGRAAAAARLRVQLSDGRIIRRQVSLRCSRSWQPSAPRWRPGIRNCRDIPELTHNRPAWARVSWFVYVVRVASGRSRRLIINPPAAVSPAEPTSVVHLQPYFRQFSLYPEGSFPSLRARAAGRRVLFSDLPARCCRASRRARAA